ncbi:Ribosome biogenesis protein WDR12-like protein [Diplonema papillatum]|nr:Ribosome biogenesis protein WDR12-like protein [Diplonema papillatum]
MARRESNMGWKPQHSGDGTVETMGGIRISGTVAAREQSESVFCVRYSGDGKYCAAACGNGAARIFETATWTPVQRLRSMAHNAEGHAATAIRWRPHGPTKAYDLIVACASGVIQQWSWDEETDAEYVGAIVEPGNEILCVDYSPDGTQFASVGSDRIVRIYDTMSGKLSHKLDTGIDARGFAKQGHTSRIFSVRFLNAHRLVTGGWESACQVWDLRTGRSDRQLLGTHVGSDGLEVAPAASTVIVASYRATNQLMLFDPATGRETTPPNISRRFNGSNLYSVKLAANQSYLVCLGSKPNAIYLVDIRTGDLIGCIKNLPETYFTLDINPQKPNEVVVGGTHSSLMTLSIPE